MIGVKKENHPQMLQMNADRMQRDERLKIENGKSKNIDLPGLFSILDFSFPFF
jgi:hypothetical protein